MQFIIEGEVILLSPRGKQANGLLTQQKMLRAAVALFLEKGYEKTTTAEIAEAAGMDIEWNQQLQTAIITLNADSSSDKPIEVYASKVINKVQGYGLELEIFNIIAFEFTEEYNAAIEAKQTAQQNALKAEQDLQRIKVEAEQTVAQAQAEAEAYRLKSEQITPQMIAMEYIDKWDGKPPAVAGGDSSSMLIDISEIINEMNTAAPAKTTPAPAAPVTTEAVLDDSAEE